MQSNDAAMPVMVTSEPPFEVDPEAADCPTPDDYTRTGYDRGHMAPNYLIATRYGKVAQRETFLMSNIVPQTPELNRGPWRILEEKGIDELTKAYNDSSFFILPDVGSEIAELERSGLSNDEKLIKKSELLRNYSEKSERLHTVQQLLKAYTLFEKDVDYVIMDNKIKIVDEQTGRIMEGRRWSDGLHQAVEAKENVKVEAATQTFATITLQNYFRMYLTSSTRLKSTPMS